MAEYILMEPSGKIIYIYVIWVIRKEQYKDIYNKSLQRLYLLKLIVEFLQEYPDSTFQDLFEKITSTISPIYNLNYNEEDLLNNAQYICDSVIFFLIEILIIFKISLLDGQKEDDDFLLMSTKCMQYLCNFSGVRYKKIKFL